MIQLLSPPLIRFRQMVFLPLCWGGLIGLLFPLIVMGQDPADEDLLQFSGVVQSSDSLRPIPYVNIYIKNSHEGTMSNFEGFFSFVAHPGDTIVFTSVGFKPQQFVIPDTLTKDRYSVRQLMARDTVQLPEAVIYPWPTKAQFREAFVNMNIPEDPIYRARKNLREERLDFLSRHMRMDANESTDYYLRQQAQQYYYSGQYPPISILNPMAWSRFFKALEEGKFKEEAKEEEEAGQEK